MKKESTGGLYVFDSVEEAEEFLKVLADKGMSTPAPEPSDDPKPTHEVSINNEQGRTIKQWVGARMEEEGNPKVYVDVTQGPIYPRDQTTIKDVKPLGIYVWRYSFYYQWWNNQQWIYVPNALQTTAASGYYYPAFGIRWSPPPKASEDSIDQEMSFSILARRPS